jgi:hypothetical protein
MFTLTIKTDGAAFGTEPQYELARLISEVASKVGDGLERGVCMDENGNHVGTWALGKARVCQHPVGGPPCEGPQWESPNYYIKTRKPLLKCELHARLSMARNPLGPQYRKAEAGA